MSVLLDMSEVSEVNALIEFMNTNEVIEVITNHESYVIIKQSGSFFAVGGVFGNRKTKLTRPPELNQTGHLYMYLNDREHVKTKQVKQILLDDKLIFESK